MMVDDLELGEMFPDYGVMHGVRLLKHLAGQHDQTTHGRWADSGLPHELENVRASLQPYFDAGLITGYFDVTKETMEYKNGEYHEIRKPTNDTLWQGGVSHTYSLPYRDENTHDLLNNLKEKFIGGNAKEIFNMAANEASKLGMGERQQLYYAQGIVSRAQLYVQLHNQILIDDFNKKYWVQEKNNEDNSHGTAKEHADQYKTFYDNFDNTAQHLSESLKSAYPVVAIDTENLLKVIEDGRFKTQYETKASNGAYKPALRREAELAISGIPLDTKASERPIYGYLATQETGKLDWTQNYNADILSVNNHGVNQYGNVRVVFDDSVKNRTSYTMLDSLDRHAIPQPLSKTDVTSLKMGGLFSNVTPSHEGKLRENYVEAQIYGGLKMKDVKKIYVTPIRKWNENTNKYDETYPEEAVKRIKDALGKKGWDKIDVELIGMEELK